MMQVAEQELSLAKLVTRHWRLMLCTMFGIVGLAGLVTILMPKKYESRIKFLVKNERADLIITPDKSSPTPAPNEVTETQVNSEIELLRSRNILETVVNDAKLYQPFETIKRTSPSRLAIERAVLRLQNDLNISVIRKTNLMQVTYRTTDPDRAAFVVRDLGDKYLSEHVAVHSAPGSYEFFNDQVGKYQAQLRGIRAAISSFHRRNQIFIMPQQQANLIDQLQQNQAQLKDVDAQFQEQQTRLAEARRQLASTSERVTTQMKQIPSQSAAQQFQTELTNFENRRIDLAMKYKPEDRLIQELDDQIRNTRRSLAEAKEGTFHEETTDLNTLHQSLTADYVKGQVALKGLESRRSALFSNVQSYLAQLNAMDGNSVSLSTLEEQQKQAEENYLLYSRRLEEARLADSLDRERFANIAIVESPVSSPVPVSPNLKLNLALGAVLGFMLALALAFIVDSAGGAKTDFVPSPPPDPIFVRRGYPAAASGD